MVDTVKVDAIVDAVSKLSSRMDAMVEKDGGSSPGEWSEDRKKFIKKRIAELEGGAPSNSRRGEQSSASREIEKLKSELKRL